MRLLQRLLALSLTGVLSACTTAKVDDPMADFAPLVGGQWRVTFASGESAFHAWLWGPDRRSMRRMAFGMADGSFADNPWAVEVLYWHPGLAQVRLLNLHGDIPGVGRGVGEGTIRFDGDTSNAVVELDQARGRRRLRQVQDFEGPDRLRETLLEDSGAGFQPLNELVFVRDAERSDAPSAADATAAREFPQHWKPFEAFVGGTWESGGDPAGKGTPAFRTTFAWEPSLEVVLARVEAPTADGAAVHVLDAYVFRDVRSDALRCLALSDRGSVAEGEVTVLDGGALQFDLRVHEGDRAQEHVARFELESDGRLRTRLWAIEGAARTLALDVAHTRSRPFRP